MNQSALGGAVLMVLAALIPGAALADTEDDIDGWNSAGFRQSWM